ncbi:2-isopropylmalate synthase [Novosphingopyxis sp.]|uniref:2-isopropylmalate synthase n=1 Tax=Novosphingopyxis sp. TaxID=2709690 RepID=UPI003B598246
MPQQDDISDIAESDVGAGMRRIAIFDTTLRDGEQAPGFSMSTAHKLGIARALADLRVDVMEAGFAAASPGDAEAVAEVAAQVTGPVICSLARTREGDIEAAHRALEASNNNRLHLFIGTSPLHREAKLKLNRDQVLREIERSIGSARGKFNQIEFSAEDAIRTERDFLIEALQVAADAGADVLNVPDTVGYTSPEEMYELFRDLTANIRRAGHVVFSTHCHDDLGMAVANSLAAVRGGAGQIECSINGIGERAGNCALEEVVMALKTRADHYRADTGIRTQGLYAASGLLAESTGNAPPRNKAVVGRNAFAHEAGIHQHGMLANRETYEIMKPDDVGMPSTLVLGKHSGKHALRARLDALGYDIGDNRMAAIFSDFKTLADTKREVTDNDLVAMIEGDDVANVWHLVRAELRTGTKATANPTAKLVVDHRTRGRLSAIGHGTGPFEALSDAFCIVAEVEGTLDSIDAHQLAREMDIEVGLTVTGQKILGRSQHTDVIVAAAEALLAAFNNHARKTNAARQSEAEPVS